MTIVKTDGFAVSEYAGLKMMKTEIHPEGIFGTVEADYEPLLYYALARCITMGDPVDVVCRVKEKGWQRVQAVRLKEQGTTGGAQLAAVMEDINGQDPESMYRRLYHKQIICLLQEKKYPTFEIDIATGNISFSDTFYIYFKCDSRNAPKKINEEKPSELIQPETRSAYSEMCRDMLCGCEGGSAVIGFLSRGDEQYISSKVSWRNVFDDHGKAARTVGVIEPLYFTNSIMSSNADADISSLRAQVALLETYFKRSEDYLKELRRYRHDRKNNIIAMTALVNSGDIEGAREYIHKVGARLEQETPLVNTDNPAIDALLSEKIREAMKLGIFVSHTVGLSPDVKVDMQDLCIAVGCCLDNAIEACQNAAGMYPETMIMVELIEKKGVIVFKLKNTSVTRPPVNGAPLESSKGDKANHGFGLKNVASVVEKYHGFYELRPGDGVFETNFTLFTDT